MIRSRIVIRALAVAAVALFGMTGCEPGQEAQPTLPPSGAEQTAYPPTESTGSALPSAGPTPTASQRPVATTAPSGPAPTASATDGCPQGEHQRAVETYLKQLGGFGTVVVDGRQSASDCSAIKKFQKRYDIRPATGRAGPVTYDVAKRLAGTDVRACNAGAATTFCVDLTRQTLWAMRDGKVIMEPTVVRTGMPGYATPAGTFQINYRNLKEWSNPYEVWLPYWQRFHGGMGLHQTTTYLHDKSIGSHGCVNLLPVDAKRAWTLGKVGATVKLFGRRPGT